MQKKAKIKNLIKCKIDFHKQQFIEDQKLTVLAPRVRDRREGKELRLMNYERLQEPRGADGGLLKRIFHELSCRRYKECVETVLEAFGLSGSIVSRRFIRASARVLKELCKRRLEGCEFDVFVMIIFGIDRTFQIGGTYDH